MEVWAEVVECVLQTDYQVAFPISNVSNLQLTLEQKSFGTATSHPSYPFVESYRCMDDLPSRIDPFSAYDLKIASQAKSINKKPDGEKLRPTTKFKIMTDKFSLNFNKGSIRPLNQMVWASLKFHVPDRDWMKPRSFVQSICLEKY